MGEPTDCKLSVAIPNTGAAANVVLQSVSTDCCSSFKNIETDLESIVQKGQLPTNLAEKDKEAIQDMCKNCGDAAKNQNMLIKAGLAELQEKLKGTNYSQLCPAPNTSAVEP